jgi:hypothetical protein
MGVVIRCTGGVDGRVFEVGSGGSVVSVQESVGSAIDSAGGSGGGRSAVTNIPRGDQVDRRGNASNGVDQLGFEAVSGFEVGASAGIKDLQAGAEENFTLGC